MRTRLHSFKYIAFLLSFLWTVDGISAPPNPNLYYLQNGGFVDLSDNAVVEGSVRFGGIQPDYIIDIKDPALKKFLRKIKDTVASSRLIEQFELNDQQHEAALKKIELVTALIKKALPEGDYDSPSYLKILAKHRLNKMDISLGSYLKCQAGVCRENALLTHLALKAVGVKNDYVYLKVRQYDSEAEDHAVVVFENKLGSWIIDPYNENFHGRNFNDLLKRPRRPPRLAEFATSYENAAQIIRINDYPIYWIPKKSGALKCSFLFN